MPRTARPLAHVGKAEELSMSRADGEREQLLRDALDRGLVKVRAGITPTFYVVRVYDSTCDELNAMSGELVAGPITEREADHVIREDLKLRKLLK